MGGLLAYTVYTGIFLLAGYLLYKWVMAGEKQMSLNRAVLLGIYALAMSAWPLSKVQWFPRHAPATIDFGEITAQIIVAAPVADTPVWPVILICIYTVGAAAVALWTASTAIKLIRLVRSGHHMHIGTRILVLLPAGKVAPFSWGRYIVMGEDDYASAGEAITAHELAHIRCRHSIDMIVAQLVCVLLWYNPAAWLMREELKTVHEYQADDSVLASGIDPRTYQMLLIKKAVGTRFQSLANSLNHSKLKKRITMMYKEKNSGLRRLRGLVLAAAPMLAVAVVNIPAIAAGLADMRAASLESVADAPDKVSEKIETDKIAGISSVDTHASFPGGEAAMMRYLAENIKYPAKAIDENRQGRVVVRFTVGHNGKLSDFRIDHSLGEDLDAEALRVVSSMPDWTPATAGGKPVDAEYTIPVSFKLSSGNVFNGTFTPVRPEQYASFPGGEAEMFRFLASNLNYPAAAMDQGRQGRVIVRFTVGTDGSLSDFNIDQSAGSDLDTEAIRVAKSMPAWIPAISDGKPVVSTYSLPVNFSLKSDKKSDSKTSDDDIVVIGYGTREKADVVAGNNITVHSHTALHIKSDSIMLGHPDDPAIFVDGKLMAENLPVPSEIESITVFKDRSDYPNGVIEITTKRADSK